MNNNIEESYCSFIISKLLKEKNFDCLCDSHYELGTDGLGVGIFRAGFVNEFGTNRSYRNSELMKIYTKDDVEYGEWTRPTHSQVIEWIRINFGIWIYVNTIVKDSINLKWHYSYRYILPNENHTLKFSKEQYAFPQEATESALLYILQNLIP